MLMAYFIKSFLCHLLKIDPLEPEHFKKFTLLLSFLENHLLLKSGIYSYLLCFIQVQY